MTFTVSVESWERLTFQQLLDLLAPLRKQASLLTMQELLAPLVVGLREKMALLDEPLVLIAHPNDEHLAALVVSQTGLLRLQLSSWARSHCWLVLSREMVEVDGWTALASSGMLEASSVQSSSPATES